MSELVQCPYDSLHRLQRKRLQQHLIKCGRNHPEVKVKICPLNRSHVIKEEHFSEHIKNCPDRVIIEHYKTNAEVDECSDKKHDPVECDENWDDTFVTDYNPQLYAQNAPILRRPDGLQKAERKVFIKEERKRLGDLSDDTDDDEVEDQSLYQHSSKKTKREHYTEEQLAPEKPRTPPPPKWQDCLDQIQLQNKQIRKKSSEKNHEPFYKIHSKEFLEDSDSDHQENSTSRSVSQSYSGSRNRSRRHVNT